MCDRFYGSGEKETDGGFVSIFQIVWVGEDSGMLFRIWRNLESFEWKFMEKLIPERASYKSIKSLISPMGE
jgi:hypothetical protein